MANAAQLLRERRAAGLTAADIPKGYAMHTSVTGLDLSLTGAGWATARDLATSNDITLTVGTVESTGKADYSLLQRSTRLRSHADNVLSKVIPGSLVIIEQPAYSSTSGSMHDRSGFWWMVVQDLLDLDYTVVEIPPTTLKMYATGKGTASKEAMVLAAERFHPSARISTNDEADALMLASMGWRHLGSPIEKLAAANLKAMVKVRWPERLAA